MDSIVFADPHALIRLPVPSSAVHHHQLPCTFAYQIVLRPPPFCISRRSRSRSCRRLQSPFVVSANSSGTTNSTPTKSGVYTVGDFMTRKEDLHVVKTTTTVDEALDALVDKRITGFPVIDDDWKLVGVVSDYDLLALDSISGGGHADANLFPDVDSSWKTFNKIRDCSVKLMEKLLAI